MSVAREYLKAYEVAGGTSFEIDSKGSVTGLTRRYFFLRKKDASALTREQLADVVGLPAIGSAYDSAGKQYAYLYATSYKVQQGSGAECEKWTVEVGYTDGTTAWNVPQAGAAEQSREYSDNSQTQDLIADQSTGEPLLNSAGDAFESVPQREVLSPVIKRVIKSNLAPSGVVIYSGCINAEQVIIDGITFAAHCGRLKVTGEKLWNDPKFSYQYNIEFCGNSRVVKLSGGAIDIGWDFGIVQSGFQYLDANGKKVRATEQNDETKEPKPTAKPVLLDATGHLLENTAVPVWRRVQAYKTVSASVITGLFK